ncbi:centrosomal protein kizuna-like [Coregonus clupeaformis]|uniref:centrosomal protein kizuna-like n=1 Tax=Coregonus clupeaformis TaxID=59861 RepID=UPI001BE0ABBA|nr:centrosomal protein kizuna-like [Coregonus clupeaformis]XP_045063370.1 centrosomal protein kizuna-like [Coregonus clupeaformis]
MSSPPSASSSCSLHCCYSTKAKVLLRTLLSRSSEECPTVEVDSESSSCGLPSFLYDSAAEVRPVRPAQEHHAAGMQGLQSGEEDSQDESPVESIPIRETKAYKLLKQCHAGEAAELWRRGGGGSVRNKLWL